MNYSLELHPIAEEELWRAVDYYDAQKGNLGKAFARELQEMMKLVRQTPFLFPKVDRQRRKAVLQKFSFVIVFEVIDDRINVLAIFHTKRNPDVWKERL